MAAKEGHMPALSDMMSSIVQAKTPKQSWYLATRTDRGATRDLQRPLYMRCKQHATSEALLFVATIALFEAEGSECTTQCGQ